MDQSSASSVTPATAPAQSGGGTPSSSSGASGAVRGAARGLSFAAGERLLSPVQARSAPGRAAVQRKADAPADDPKVLEQRRKAVRAIDEAAIKYGPSGIGVATFQSIMASAFQKALGEMKALNAPDLVADIEDMRAGFEGLIAFALEKGKLETGAEYDDAFEEQKQRTNDTQDAENDVATAVSKFRDKEAKGSKVAAHFAKRKAKAKIKKFNKKVASHSEGADNLNALWAPLTDRLQQEILNHPTVARMGAAQQRLSAVLGIDAVGNPSFDVAHGIISMLTPNNNPEKALPFRGKFTAIPKKSKK